MSLIAFFVKNGVIVRKADTDVTPQANERVIYIDEEKAKELQVFPFGSSLYDKPEGFPYRKIPEADIQTTGPEPVEPEQTTTTGDYWGRLVYDTDTVTLSAGEGLNASVFEPGTLAITFDAAFKDESSFGVWLSFETPDITYHVENSVSGNGCAIYLKTDGEAATQATVHVFAKGRLA